MTDRASGRASGRVGKAGLPLAGRAEPQWDPLLRLVHWGLAAVVLANFALTKAGGAVHMALGWAGLALLLLRMIWGLFGPAEARFSSFPPNPMAGLRHLGGLMRGRVRDYPSHNPAGALMAYALWACLGVIVLTGLGMSSANPLVQADLEAAVAAGDWSVLVKEEDGEAATPGLAAQFGEGLEEVHEVAANLIVFLALLHVAGVAVESRVMGRNLVRAMLPARRGRKR